MDPVLGTDSQDSDDLVPPDITSAEYDKAKITVSKKNVVLTSTSTLGSKRVTSKGIENAKKRLRAFSIQKKTPITAVTVPKPVNTTGGATVLIGKLSSVKTTPKPEVLETEKKPPKPPKPGAFRKNLQDSYCSLQKRTLSEIEDMKRKMELVDLGIPLGLICPSATSEKAMPTKAMPPIKSFLARRFRVLRTEACVDPWTHAKRSKGKRKRNANNPSRVDELIREAKKAKAEGREFKFDYQKLLPDYDNPFQRKKDDLNAPERKDDEYYTTIRSDRYDDRDRSEKRKSDKYERSDYTKADRKDDKDKHKDSKEKHKDKDKGESRKSERKVRNPKETDVDLNDYLVCDSWSLDNEDRSGLSPRVDKAGRSSVKDKSKEPMDILRRNFKRRESRRSDSPAGKPKMEKLQPVIDAFKFDIDPNPDDDEFLDIPDEQIEIEKFAKRQSQKKTLYESPIDLKLFEYDQDMSKEDVIDANDDNFLESVINEIKQENMSDDASQDKGLVEYDSPKEDEEEDSKFDTSQGSVTPELDDRMRDLQSSQQSHYSDGYRSTESYKSIESESYKSVESGYKSTESYKVERDYKSKDSRHMDESRQSDDFRQSIEKELDVPLEQKMSRSTVDSLETWSFVLKICQPLLFRHDRNKCYKETHTAPKLWYTVNPKTCSCVKDRSVVYKELEMCKMTLVDLVYGCDQIPLDPCPSARAWYPRITGCMPSSSIVPVATVWETDDQATPPQNKEMCLDQEYQRFMQAVWPDVADPKADTSRSTTPIRQESRKMKKTEDTEKEVEDKKKVKKIKLSSEGWSQESDMEEDTEKTKKLKADKEKIRKRKHTTSSSDSDSEVSSKKKKRIKKKGDKKTKAKLAKRRRVSKKIKKKLKDQKKKNKKKIPKIEKISDDSEEEKREVKKMKKKIKKKKQPKLKKTLKKKKTKPKSSSSSSTSSSSSSSSSSDSESEVVKKKKIKKKEAILKKKKKDKKKKRRVSTDSTQSKDQELFDVNVLKNIKTERLTDDEKNQQMNDFSPRRQKPREREIINVKELQNDFVGKNILIKQEKEDTPKETVSVTDKTVEEERNDSEMSDEGKSPESVHAASVENETTDIVIKEQPSPIEREELSPEILLPDDRSIPLPDDLTTVVHDDSSIPLPAELTVQSIPEPPPQIIQQNREDTVKSIEVAQPIPQTYEYCYPDVSASHNELYGKGMEMDSDDKFGDGCEHGNYEMYEQMAMAYQSDVANQLVPVERSPTQAVRRIETVVRCRRRGEIKCDWRAGDKPASTQELPRPSRWGLKPGEVNIVLTGGPSEPSTPVVISAAPMEQFPIRSVLEPVYRVQSLANRHDGSNSALGYDEAYQVTYGAADRLQYGDCFGETAPSQPVGSEAPRVSTLDERITRVLRESVLGDVAKETDDMETDTDAPEKGILVMKSLAAIEVRAVKRVTFADGYRPGQDSDVEEPPVKRKKKPRRLGCAWPCPATHPDHVPLWDALPPPPPPRSPPPPAPAPHPPLHLLRHQPAHALPRIMHAQDSKTSLPVFMPPEPPPGLITFQ